MSTLLETIRQNLNKPAELPASGQTETVRGLLRAKTGKEQPTGGGVPRQSALQEKLAHRQTQLGAEQQQQRGQLLGAQQEQQQADIAQRTAQQAQQFEQQKKDMQAKADRQTLDILDQFQRGQKTLSNMQDLADIEQVGFNIRFDNKQYIDQINQEGRKKRFDNMVNFKKELAKDVMSNHSDLLTNQLAFERMLAADDREFIEELSKIDLDFAVRSAESAAKAASSRQMAEGVGGLISAGVQGVSHLDKKGFFNSKPGQAQSAPQADIQATNFDIDRMA